MASSKKKRFGVDDLWALARLGAPSLSPDGAQAVCTVTRPSMKDNRATSELWLLSTLGGRPRALTTCGEKDGQPRWSPAGDAIAFVAKRDQEGARDETPQLYLIAPDGGEARRLTSLATGVESFRWFPDGRRIAFVSWVWPTLKGAKAQAKRHAEDKARKETGYATSESLYRHWDHHLPAGRVPHVHVVDIGEDGAARRVRDVFEGTAWELSRTEPDAHTFDISPDGRHLVFAHDPAEHKRIDGRHALIELDLRRGTTHAVAADAAWNFAAPRYSPDGRRIAFTASHQGRRHTMPAQIAVASRRGGDWAVVSTRWDHDVHAPLHWRDDGGSLSCLAEDRGQQHLWRFDLATGSAEVVVAGGWVQGYDEAGGTCVTVADAMLHPSRVHAHRGGEPPRRLEQFNDEALAAFDLGHAESVEITGAAGEPVQMWLVYPPGFQAKGKTKGKTKGEAGTYPLLQVIHGGPHAASGDTFHARWNNALFAAQGYVVVGVNYHGSSGFGHAFLDSITHHWGEYELQDLEAATDWCLAQPWADAKRVFATGGSYGGYLVAWMNAHVPEGRYAAYVCHAGCFDWTAMFADDAYFWHAKELGAFYWDDLDRVHAQSPHAHAKHMRTPTLVIHGALDYRVPDAQGLAYYNTLKAKGVDARLLWFPDENHWVLKPRNSAQWYGEYFAWLKRHDPGASR